MFSNRDLRKLMIPLVIEQLLTSLIGTVDTMMVSNVGESAISGVSLVDSVNKLAIFLLTSVATGGTIICAQYLGRRDRENFDRVGRQVLLTSLVVSLLLFALCRGLCSPLLHLIFGKVDADVMTAAETYFRITAYTYPFIGLSGAVSALYRSAGNSRLPMAVSVASNMLNIAGNAVLMFVFGMGVAGAALATLASYLLNAAVLLVLYRRPGREIQTGPYLKIRPDRRTIWLILCIGIPTGVENSMFQFGKLIVQSTVSTLGTAAIAANAIVVVLELMTSFPVMGLGTGLTTVAGQCIGAGRPDEAKRYIKKITLWSAGILLLMNWLIFALTRPVTVLAGMEPATAELTVSTMLVISIVKPFLWPLAFIPPYGMRAAGDVRFGMIASSVIMWVIRVGLTTLLCRGFGMGLIGIWCGYFADWLARTAVFTLRFRSGKWLSHEVIRE